MGGGTSTETKTEEKATEPAAAATPAWAAPSNTSSRNYESKTDEAPAAAGAENKTNAGHEAPTHESTVFHFYGISLDKPAEKDKSAGVMPGPISFSSSDGSSRQKVMMMHELSMECRTALLRTMYCDIFERNHDKSTTFVM